MSDESQKPKGGRNLTILGLGAIAIAVITTSISIFIYRQNDIYLDRSRPGFIAEGEGKDEDTVVNFSDEGEITTEVIQEYLKELEAINNKIDANSSAFSENPLSDATLGIDETADFFNED